MQPQLVAHRGWPARYPENTLVGYEAVIAAGARFIETDVQLTADGVPVLYHDRTLARVSARPGAVHQYDWAALRRFAAFEFERFGYRFARTPIARLEELAGLLQRHAEVAAFVEIKRISVERFGADTVARKVLPLLEPLRGRCVVISYDPGVLLAVRERGWLEIGAVVDHWRQRRARRITVLRPQYLFCGIRSLPRWRRARWEYGRVAVFETSDPGLARWAARHGAAFVETDDWGGLAGALWPEHGPVPPPAPVPAPG